MWPMIKDIISGAAAFFRFREKQGDRLNTEEMRANARAKQDAKTKDAIAKAIADNDLDEIRRRASE